MYKYSRTAQDRFFSEPVFAYLFACFATEHPARAFAESKFRENKDD